jgi:hypothetical protein
LDRATVEAGAAAAPTSMSAPGLDYTKQQVFARVGVSY